MKMESGRCWALVGAQWGDEGKGKLVDYSAEYFDYIVRSAGGENAGHTVKRGEQEPFKFHLIPSGILYPDKVNVLGNGMVINPVTLVEEIDSLQSRRYSAENLVISDRAHVVMPWHKLLDGAKESLRKEKKIGTTKRGIGPAYQDKAGRAEAIRVCDLLEESVFREKMERAFPLKKLMLDMFGIEADYTKQGLIEEYIEYGKRLRPYVRKNTSYMLNEALDEGKRILLEGAQGTMLDLDHGTYPYVTSSNPTIGGACTGTGIPANRIDHVIGVAKLYTTRVGKGPLPTELGSKDLMAEEDKDSPLTEKDFEKANDGEEYYQGKVLRKQGMEYGTTTGRPRRCGWFDAVCVNYAVMINGVDVLALTKLDVLSGLEELKICVAYKIDGECTRMFPSTSSDLEAAEPVYETYEGWERMGRKEWLEISRGEAELPREAQEYLDAIQEEIGIPSCLISVGPEQEATISTESID
ncbi:MAG: adenylosuccinate synthase [Thermoproteota archaeon]